LYPCRPVQVQDELFSWNSLDRTTASSLYSAGTFIASFSLVWVGRKIDVLGNRRMGVILGALFAIVLVLCSLITGPIMLLFAFIGIRGLGQGALSLVSSTSVANWFKSSRGRMMSLMALGSVMFQALYVNVLRVLLETMDWRHVFVYLGVAVGIVVVPLFGFLMRNKPEEFGLLPDNAQIDKFKNDEVVVEIEEDNWTLKEAMRAPILWVFLFAKLLPSGWGTGIILHQISLFAGLNHSAQTATEVFALMAFFSAGASLLSGLLVDKFRPSAIVALQMGAMLMTCMLSTLMTETWLLIVYAASFGLVMGVGSVFDGAVWANLFGRKYQGEIRGFVITASVVGSAIGPVLFGLSFDLAGSYTLILWVGAILCGIAGILSFITPEPKRRTPSLTG
jgi:MFS family permease